MARDPTEANGEPMPASSETGRPAAANTSGSGYIKYAVWALVGVAIAAVIFMAARPSGGGAPTGVTDVGNAEFKKAVAAGYQVVDVRTPQEYAQGHIPGAVNVPIDVLPQTLSAIDKGKPVAVYCATGARSLNAKQFLAAQGFGTVVNLAQGIAAWDGQTLAGDQPGDRATVLRGATPGSGDGSAGAPVTVKTSGIPVFVDLFSPA
jgi:phage shock protein E